MLTSLGAWISIPLPVTPVPITLQVFFVMLAGAILGARLGAVSEIIYVLLGLVGFPVFAGAASDPGILIGPTGGYLISYPLAAYTTGRLAEVRTSPGFRWMIIATLAGLCPIYVLDEIWLWAWLKTNLIALLIAGVIPFLPVDIAKGIVAASVASRQQVKHLFQRNSQTFKNDYLAT